MADINIEKKKNTPVWPWILGLLFLAGIVWAVSEMNSDPEREEMAYVEDSRNNESIEREPQANRISETGTAAMGFVKFVEEKDIEDRMDESHQFTSEALNKLSSSLRELSGNDNRYAGQIEEINQIARDLGTNTQSPQHSAQLHRAFNSAATVMHSIQQERFPDAGSEVEDVKEAANKLDSNKLLQDQKDKVKDFFEEAADAVEEMEGKARK